MRKIKRVALPHSLVLISEPGKGEVPPSFEDSVIVETPTCIAVACRLETDGGIELVLGSSREFQLENSPEPYGPISVPSLVVALQTVYNEPILEMKVPSGNINVAIWINGRSEPDRIIVGLDLPIDMELP